MAADDDKNGAASGLSIKTLLISAASAVASAVLVPLVWEKGTLIATALTPIVVAIVSNLLEKPVNKVTSIRVVRNAGEPVEDVEGDEEPTVVIVPETMEPPAVDAPTLILPSGVDLDTAGADALAHDEPDERAGWRDRIRANLPNFRGRRARIVVVTGILGFLLGGTFITVSELAAGGSVSLNKRTTLLPGSVDTSDLGDDGGEATPTPTFSPTPSSSVTGSQTPEPSVTIDDEETERTPTATATPDDDDTDGDADASPSPTPTATPTATATSTPTATATASP